MTLSWNWASKGKIVTDFKVIAIISQEARKCHTCQIPIVWNLFLSLELHSLPWLRKISFIDFISPLSVFLSLPSIHTQSLSTLLIANYFFCRENWLFAIQFFHSFIDFFLTEKLIWRSLCNLWWEKVNGNKLWRDWCCLMDSVRINFPQKWATLHLAMDRLVWMTYKHWTQHVNSTSSKALKDQHRVKSKMQFHKASIVLSDMNEAERDSLSCRICEGIWSPKNAIFSHRKGHFIRFRYRNKS